MALNRNDRCDRCAAQAKVWVMKGSDDLMFCEHHYRTLMKELAMKSWEVRERVPEEQYV